MLRRPELPDGLQRSGFYSVMEGAPRCMISRWTVLRLLGIKVQFQASSTFCVQPVSGLCSCGQQFSSGGLLPIETRMCGRPLSISFRELGVQWFCCVVVMVLSDTSFPAWQLFFVSISSHFPIINSRVSLFETQGKPGRLTQMPFTLEDTDTGLYMVSVDPSYSPHYITGTVSAKISTNRKFFIFKLYFHSLQ